MVVVSQQEREAVLKIFPIILEITDTELQEKVIRTWVRVWQESKVASLEDVYNEKEHPQFTVVAHTRATAGAALAMAGAFEAEYGFSINRDYLIAAGILHDVDKPVVFQMKEGKMIPSEFGRLVPHGGYGFLVAMEEGLPYEIAHICLTHAGTCTVHPGTHEGILLEYADKAVARALRVAHGEILPAK